ncbi:MAG: hypothetical protein JNL70_23625 [Saprospiraceae bacterium]|nr:hypothetical protein [Saprospiraceae bacterium]
MLTIIEIVTDIDEAILVILKKCTKDVYNREFNAFIIRLPYAVNNV